MKDSRLSLKTQRPPLELDIFNALNAASWIWRPVEKTMVEITGVPWAQEKFQVNWVLELWQSLSPKLNYQAKKEGARLNDNFIWSKIHR